MLWHYFYPVLLQLMLQRLNNILSLYSFTEENIKSKNLPVPSEYLKNEYSYCSSSTQLPAVFYYSFIVEEKTQVRHSPLGNRMKGLITKILKLNYEKENSFY
jgi:hypothetical protein